MIHSTNSLHTFDIHKYGVYSRVSKPAKHPLRLLPILQFWPSKMLKAKENIENIPQRDSFLIFFSSSDICHLTCTVPRSFSPIRGTPEPRIIYFSKIIAEICFLIENWFFVVYWIGIHMCYNSESRLRGESTVYSGEVIL